MSRAITFGEFVQRNPFYLDSGIRHALLIIRRLSCPNNTDIKNLSCYK